MRIAICEDRKEDAEKLQTLLNRYLQTQGFVAYVDFFESGEAFLAAFHPGKYRIVFMDIFMAPHGLNGMDTAESSTPKMKKPQSSSPPPARTMA